jgi:bifunctional non-homologous end joining protein LigD
MPERKSAASIALFEPIAPTLTEEIPPEEKFICETKLNGIRALSSVIKNGEIIIVSRSQRNITDHFPEIAIGLYYLSRNHSLHLDGEIISPPGKTEKQKSMATRRINMSPASCRLDTLQDPLVYVVFDLRAIDGEDLSEVPLLERRRRLARIIPPELQRKSGIVVLPYTDRNLARYAAIQKQQGYEGVVFKQKDSGYPDRVTAHTSPWLKMKF